MIEVSTGDSFGYEALAGARRNAEDPIELDTRNFPNYRGAELRLIKLTVHNYKSLRNVVFRPTPLTAIVGPNASGKTNFSDAVDFLSEVYSNGLELAIARKGGYENIAFRKMRRTKAPIEFEIVVEVMGADIRRFSGARRDPSIRSKKFVLSHRFSIHTSGTGIRADFNVLREEFVISLAASDLEMNSPRDIIRVHSGADRRIEFVEYEQSAISEEVKRYTHAYFDLFAERSPLSGQELFINALPLRNAFFTAFSAALSNFEVYQISPRISRSSGVPTPNPKLSRLGENLPALVDWIQRKHPKAWESVLDGMRDVLTGLTEIRVDYLHNKTLGLFFEEDGAKRPWDIEDVSDGTIQTLALLVASADPRATLLLVEEPENSVHPWIIRVLVRHFRSLSVTRNVILTSHSPVVIDLMAPGELWIMSRTQGETQLHRMVDLEPSVLEGWETGRFRLSEFLDAGFVPQAVPGGSA